jgi:hypothetical protein
MNPKCLCLLSALKQKLRSVDSNALTNPRHKSSAPFKLLCEKNYYFEAQKTGELRYRSRGSVGSTNYFVKKTYC